MQINDIKQSARLQLSGKYIKSASSSLLFFIIITILTFFQETLANVISNTLLLIIVQLIFIIIQWILNYGIISNILDLVNGKTNSIIDFINNSFKNCSNILKLGFYLLSKILIPLIINIFSFFYFFGTKVAQINKKDFLCFRQNLTTPSLIIWIISSIILLYFVLKYILINYVYYDKPSFSSNNILDKSKNLMQKNKLNYIILLLSFLHWFLLGALLILILNTFIKGKYLVPFMAFFYSIIRPYIIVSKYEFFKILDENK